MIERELRAGVLTLRLAHGKANALDLELVEALARALPRELTAAATPSLALPGAAQSDGDADTDGDADADADADNDADDAANVDADAVRAVILTGTGSVFSAGVDLKRFVDGGPEYARRFFPELCKLLRRVFTFEKPLLAAVNGHAVAGGCLLVFACDHRLMAAGGGRIGLPELQVGLPFPAIAHEIVRFAVPAPRVQPLVYAGTMLPPEEALRAGFLEEVVAPDALEARAREVAAQYAALSPEVFAHTKRFLRDEALKRLAQREAEADAEALALWCAPGTQRRVREYVERMLGG